MRANTPSSTYTPSDRILRSAAAALAAMLLVAGLSACGASVGGAGDVVLELVAIAPQSAIPEAERLDGATVEGAITVAVRATTDLARVAFELDNTPIGERDVAPFEVAVDTRALADGLHELVARATLGDGAAQVARAVFAVANGVVAPIPDPEPAPAPGTPFVAPPATLYVAPNGNDANDGRTIDHPTTLNHATQIAQPGDTIYLRGGTYPIQTRFTRSGTATQPITWTSHPGEWAILDGSNQTPVTSGDRIWIQASWNVFANFEISHSPQEGIQLYQAHDNLLTHLVTHHNHYSGILVMQSNRNRFEYITTHDNYDEYNQWGRQGDDADGISLSSGDRNTIYRMISYNNSDDGIDTWRSTNSTIDSSITFNNGRGTHGNGNGIKAGGNYDTVNTLVINTIAFNNKANGFDDNTGQGVRFYNNTAYGNQGFAFAFGTSTTLHNNLAHGSPIGAWGGTHTHNSWNLDLTNPQFLSTDPNHPEFLALAPTSPAIDQGTDLGLPHTGTAPDLGALEHTTYLTELIGQPLTTATQPTTLAQR